MSRLLLAAVTVGSLALVACGSKSASESEDASVSKDGSTSDGRSDASKKKPDSSAPREAGTDATDAGVCPSPVPADPFAAKRAACTFTAGALVEDTLGIDPATRAAIPIDHIIVMMKENRSFDHLLGLLHDLKPAVAAIPTGFSNRVAEGGADGGAEGGLVRPFHQTSACISHDPNHSWAAMHEQVDNGKMDGFVKSCASSTGTDGYFAMSYYDQTDLPFYYWLATTYAINDRHFASERTSTWPNRDFMYVGTAAGVMDTGDGYPASTIPTIFDSLDTAGVTWGVYSDGTLLEGALGWDSSHVDTGTYADLLQGLDDATLPQVVFVDGIDPIDDDHPTANVQEGELWSRTMYLHATASTLWPKLAMIWTYDEGGGFADHVPPPNMWCIARPGNPEDTAYFELGVRVPLTVISPWARADYTSHVVQEHTAVTRFIETVFNLPALTSRDANSDALLDLFDFACPPSFLKPTAPPAAGTGECDAPVALTVASPTFTVGESIVVSFTGAPGNDPKDWIGVYSYTADGPTPPDPGPLMKVYIGGSQTATTSPVSGSVTLGASAAAGATWPLAAGNYIAYYLLDDGYGSIASVDFNVVP
jgi:phospholipase C